jgi:predicted amidohydrolase YtcJ
MRTVVVGPGEQLRRAQALTALTRAAPRSLGRARARPAPPGWAADLTLERDPLTAPLDELIGLTTRLTMVGGDVVHHA